MMAIRGVLFDKDGTLIQANGTWVPFYKEVLRREFGLAGEKLHETLARAGYDPVTDTFFAGSILAGGTTRQIVDLWWPDESPAARAAIVDRLYKDYAPLARHSLEALMPLQPVLQTLLDDGLKLGIATNDSQASAFNHMSALDVQHFFAKIIGEDSVSVPKPSGQMVALFAEATRLSPAEIVMVGDNTHDLEEARNGGAGLAIGVLSGNSDRVHLDALADHVLDSIAELPALLRSL
jgi:phosphoglycolate phosphatase